MEFFKGINPKYLFLARAGAVLAAGLTAGVVSARAEGNGNMQADIKCSDGHEYAGIMTEPHIDIFLQAHGFERFTNDPAHLYLYASDAATIRSLLVGYNSNADSFNANMHGRVGSINGQGSLVFENGRTYNFQLHRGPKRNYEKPDNRPITELAAEVNANIDCSTPAIEITEPTVEITEETS